MKKIFLIFIHIVFLMPLLKGQSLANQSNISVDKSGKPMLLGPCEEIDLQKEPFASWYVNGLKSYKPDSLCCDSIRTVKGTYSFHIFFGSWCGDSKRNVPQMMKALMESGFTQNNISLIAVSNIDTLYKQSPTHEERGLNIIRVPTLIIRKNGVETGRIVESPIESIEKDLLKIFLNRPYTPNYAGL